MATTTKSIFCYTLVVVNVANDFKSFLENLRTGFSVNFQA